MPYDTGTTTSHADLHSRINTFLTANGWTQDGNVLYKGNVFAEVTDDTSYLQVKGGQGQSGGTLTTPCAAVSRISTVCWGPDIVFPCTYHFFAHSSPDMFMCVLNHNTLYVQWMTFGELNKYGTWNGGQYYGSSYNTGNLQNRFLFYNWESRFYNTQAGQTTNVGIGLFWAAKYASNGGYGNMQMVCDIEGALGDWIDNYGTLSAGNPAFNGSYYARDLVPYSPNTFNTQATLIPINIYVGRASAFNSIVGEPGHTRYVNIKHYNIGDIITLGAEKWMVFPHAEKSAHSLTDPGSTTSSTDTSKCQTGYLGFAVRYDGP